MLSTLLFLPEVSGVLPAKPVQPENKVNEVTAKRIKKIRKYFMFIRVPHRILLKNYCF
jgi:hypothetical protein